MSVLLYAVAAELDPAGRAGLEGHPLRALTRDGLSAVLSDIETPPAPDIAHLWSYHEVVLGLMADGPLLPARFGTTAESERELESMLVERHDEFTRSLTHVGNRVEYAVSIPPPPAAEPAQSGTDYMERLRAREACHRALEARAELRVRDARRTAHGTAYLVEREGAEAFVAEAGALGLTVVGPWPPYSFVSGA